ncbi:Tn7 transposition protein A [Virgibacillus soli]|nr:Tn7 transposition protein A [Virgibacillus soli]
MAKRKNGWTEEKISKYIKEGRGQGELSNYIPWLKIQDVSSNGNVSRFQGWKTKRQHEFLSNLERSYFFLLEWSDDVYDIREQFPLERELTFQIAEAKEIHHSIDKVTQTPIVMTTDFFVTIKRNNKKEYLARTIKPSELLEDKRVIEKFEVEREYWEGRGVDWGIITEKDIEKVTAKNIQWIYEHYYLDQEEDTELASLFLKLLINKQSENKKIFGICNYFDETYQLETGSALGYFKHLIARKYITFDMKQKLNVRSLTTNQMTLITSKKVGKDIDYISG